MRWSIRTAPPNPENANTHVRGSEGLTKAHINHGGIYRPRDGQVCIDTSLSHSASYLPWPDNVLHKALEEAYPQMQWLIMAGLYLGQREQDDIKLLWSHYDGVKIAVLQQKTGKCRWIEAHPRLKEVLDGIPRTAATIFTTQRGQVWTGSNMQHQIQKHMKDIGFPGYSRHGLRKNAVIGLLEAGCTTHEVMSATGQTEQMVAHYALQVSQKKMAASAIDKLARADGTGTKGR